MPVTLLYLDWLVTQIILHDPGAIRMENAREASWGLV